MASYATLAFDHEAHLHDTQPHPSCPICERHRVAGTRVVDTAAVEAVSAQAVEIEPRTLGFGDIRDAVEHARDLLGQIADKVLDALTELENLKGELPDGNGAETLQDRLDNIAWDLQRIVTDTSDALVGDVKEQLGDIETEATTAEKEAEEVETSVANLDNAIAVLFPEHARS
ncbi:hypothetical protein ACFL6C_02950 [Myxococcota bacterium]